MNSFFGKYAKALFWIYVYLYQHGITNMKKMPEFIVGRRMREKRIDFCLTLLCSILYLCPLLIVWDTLDILNSNPYGVW